MDKTDQQKKRPSRSTIQPTSDKKASNSNNNRSLSSFEEGERLGTEYKQELSPDAQKEKYRSKKSQHKNESEYDLYNDPHAARRNLGQITPNYPYMQWQPHQHPQTQANIASPSNTVFMDNHNNPHTFFSKHAIKSIEIINDIFDKMNMPEHQWVKLNNN